MSLVNVNIHLVETVFVSYVEFYTVRYFRDMSISTSRRCFDIAIHRYQKHTFCVPSELYRMIYREVS